jgi:hypothetical protein
LADSQIKTSHGVPELYGSHCQLSKDEISGLIEFTCLAIREYAPISCALTVESREFSIPVCDR